MDYKTKILHNGNDIDPFTGASSIPVYQASTFSQADPTQFGQYVYARGMNPTREALENTIAYLEGGEVGSAFSSGVAAISSVFLLFKPGDHIIAAEDVYGGTYHVLTGIFSRWELKHTFVNMTDPMNIERAVLPETRAIFAETPSNPLLAVTDLRAVSAIAKKYDLLTIIDNTFMSPYLQRPIEFGFDIVIHSATKFLGGHSDVVGGLAVAKDPELGKKMRSVQTYFGAILGPMDSWLILRGIKTLSARMDVQQANALRIAQLLSGNQKIKKVFYPGLAEHPGHDIHMKQASGGGAVITFELENGRIAQEMLKNVKLCLTAVSLGGVESILSYPTTMSHSAMSGEERYKRGITDGIVRLSVGLEDPKDLYDDISEALEKACT